MVGNGPTSSTGRIDPMAIASAIDAKMDGQPDAGDERQLRPLHLRNEGRLLRRHAAHGVAQHALDRRPDLRHAR